MSKQHKLSAIPLAIAIAGCTTVTPFEASNPDGSKSKYNIYRSAGLFTPSVLWIDRWDQDAGKEDWKPGIVDNLRDTQSVAGQLAAPAAAVGAAVLWPHDEISAVGGSVSATAKGGNATAGASASSSASSSAAGDGGHKK